MKPAERPISAPAPVSAAHRRIQRIKLLAVLLVCASPVIASYLAYYVFPPMGRTNFGELIEPQRPVPALQLQSLQGQPTQWQPLLGQWILLQVDSGRCDTPCADKLYALRQHRTMTGKERERIDRVWLVSDDLGVSASVLEGHEGLVTWRAPAQQLAQWLPVEPGRSMTDYLYVIDPQGNLMMRFDAKGEPKRIHKDISRLLKASRIG
jgi:cytochrome oxidase Cu insertion factor (SCO1/SenC/PrrC family)